MFLVKSIELNKLRIKFSEAADVLVILEANKLIVKSLNAKPFQMEVSGVKEKAKQVLQPASQLIFTVIN